MNLRQLETLKAVIDGGSTARAADLLNVSQPAISNMIKHMESQSGLRLFERIKGRLWPTDEAKQLYDDVAPIFLLFRSVQAKVQDLRDAKSGSLRIVATPNLGHSIVPRALAEFLADRPDVKVSLDVRRTENILDHIDHRIADMGLTLSSVNHPTVTQRPIHMGQMVCVVPNEHQLAAENVISPQSLSRHPFVTMERDTPLGNLISQAFQVAETPYNWNVETRFSYTAYALAQRLRQPAVVDEFTVAGVSDDTLLVKPFTPTVQLHAYILHLVDRPLSNIATAFIEAVQLVSLPSR